ncbi:hypothetical protein SOVF_012990 isoform B [Spinacia oleracea]|nr:hypothetical protein SOVF_012990 isoform B [Spinacia oleracea]
MVPVFFHSQCAHFAPVDHVPAEISVGLIRWIRRVLFPRAVVLDQ